ncbi:MAG: tRNA (guanosine(37)-N1)-methyltransferase TrmD [Planctomycetes bacterium]|nr:tRNA (guanosine(37)-N1)-methyltransferase TrmD [Planctomycetota bacterium]
MPLFAILTLFPEALEPYTRESILGVAQTKGLAKILLVDLRDFTRDRHRTVDDRPFGGGPGMLLKPEPIVEAVEWLEAKHGRFRKFATCPTGRTFRQTVADEIAREERVLILCGRYEGFDDRVRELCGFEDLSLGDFVLSGGELPALTIVEAAVRLLPGVLGNEESVAADSFQKDGLLDHPQYTRPRVFRGLEVPEVLVSGDHAAVQRWRERTARERTRVRRPDLSQNTTSQAKPESPEADHAPDRTT